MTTVRLGLRENLGQFSLLVVINAFVGAMVGMERSILPAIAQDAFGLTARAGMLSFIVVFGLTKAAVNYATGRLADRAGRKQLLVAGWFLACPVPFLLMWAPTWTWVLVANALLGASQGLTWSTTVIMKIDLVGPRHRGLAMGLNEFSGYLAVAAAAFATGWIAARAGLRPHPFYLGVAFAAAGLTLSLLVRETKHHAALESRVTGASVDGRDSRSAFWQTTFGEPTLSTATQAGLVNNLNDGMAWGLFPLLFAAQGMTFQQIGVLTAVYPGTWGAAQVATGALADRIGRKWLVASGMWLQAAAIGSVSLATTFSGFVAGAILLGVGTAMVYPTLLAVVSDVAAPAWRASAIGVYRLWRDLGYAIGALVAGVAADAFGLPAAMWIVAALTFLSGVAAAVRMRETLGLGRQGSAEARALRPAS
jgi:MFS family permease